VFHLTLTRLHRARSLTPSLVKMFCTTSEGILTGSVLDLGALEDDLVPGLEPPFELSLDERRSGPGARRAAAPTLLGELLREVCRDWRRRGVPGTDTTPISSSSESEVSLVTIAGACAGLVDRAPCGLPSGTLSPANLDVIESTSRVGRRTSCNRDMSVKFWIYGFFLQR